MSDTLKGDDLHQELLFMDLMAKNREERLEREFLEQQHSQALEREQKRARARKMSKLMEEFVQKLPELREDLYNQVQAWLRETGAEPGELKISVPTQEQLRKLPTPSLWEDCWSEEALELSRLHRSLLWIKSTDPSLYGGIDGLVYYDIEESDWVFPAIPLDFRGEEEDRTLPTKRPSEGDNYW